RLGDVLGGPPLPGQPWAGRRRGRRPRDAPRARARLLRALAPLAWRQRKRLPEWAGPLPPAGARADHLTVRDAMGTPAPGHRFRGSVRSARERRRSGNRDLGWLELGWLREPRDHPAPPELPDLLRAPIARSGRRRPARGGRESRRLRGGDRPRP